MRICGIRIDVASLVRRLTMCRNRRLLTKGVCFFYASSFNEFYDIIGLILKLKGEENV